MVRSRSYIATPPGATIREQLDDRGMSQKEFAARMDMSEKHISKLINGEVQLTPEMAMRLEFVLGISANFWNNLESIYREKLLKIKEENSMDQDIELAKELPYNEMAKLGWIPSTRNIVEKVVYLRKYFEVVELSLLENMQVTRIACRRLAINEKSDLALMAWAQKVKLYARNMATAPIDIKGLIADLPKIRSMTRQKPDVFASRLKEMLAKRGVALVFVPHLTGSFLHGATFIDGGKIVIGLTARGKDADKFWFSLFHELGHIILGHIGLPNGTSEMDEKAANDWAGEVLIRHEELESFLQRNLAMNPQNICKFAEEQGVAPGIVVGRLQNDGLIKHYMFNELKEHYDIA